MKKRLSILMLLAALVVPWASRAQSTLTVCDGTGTNTHYPVNGLYVDTYGSCNEFIIPASMLSDMEGATINSMTFYISSSATLAWTGTIQIYLGETEATSVASFSTPSSSSVTVVYTGLLDATGSTMTVTFTTPYEYNGGNLLVGSFTSVAGNYKSATFKGMTQADYTARYRTSATGTGTQEKFIPKTTFSYVMGNVSCYAVKNLAISEITGESVTLSWSDTSNSSATYTVYAVSATDTTVIEDGITDTFYTVEDLDPTTDYRFAVAADCGAGDESSKRYISATTACMAVATDSLPWIYGFEDATGSGSSYSFNQCMGRYTNYTTAYPYTSSTNKHSGTYSLYFYSTSSYYSYVTLPLFEEELSQLQLSFWAYRTSTASYGHYIVGLMTDPSDLSTFDTIATGQVGNAWELVEVPLNAYTGNGRYLAILSPNMSAASYIYIDDIKVDYLPTCYRASAVDTTEVTPNSASFAITHDEASTFMVLWHKTGSTAWDTLDVSGNTFTLTGLASGYGYEGRVYTICGEDTTEGFLAFSVTAGCSAITAADLPYSEDFESYGSGATYPINGCWTKGTSSSTAFPYPTNTAANGDRSLYLYGYYPSSATTTKVYSWVALPPIGDDLEMSDLMVNFIARRGSSSGDSYYTLFYVGVADSVNGFVDTAALSSQVTWIDTIDFSSEPASSVNAAEVSFDGYSGTGKYVVFYAPIPALRGSATFAYNYIYLDDVVLREIPSCFWPSSVVVDSVSSDEVTLSWTPDPRTPSPDSWTVEYGPVDFTAGEGTTVTSSDTTVAIGNLSPRTTYEFHVMANCGGTLSDPANIIATTDCEPLATTALPWSEDFDSMPTTTVMATIPCWRFVSSGASNSYVAVVAAHPHSTPNSIRFNGNCPTPLMAVLPPMENVGGLEMSMWLYSENTTTSGSIRVGYITVPTDTTTFVETARFEASSGDFNPNMANVTVTFPGAPDGAYIAIQQVQASTANYWWWVDDIEVHTAPTCPRAQDFYVASVSHESVDVVILDTNYEGDYVITLTDASDSVLGVFNTSDTSYTITGLTPQTAYKVTMVTDCGDGTYTAPYTLNVRTACVAIPTDSLPYVEDFETYSTGSSASISPCWTKDVSGSTTQYPYPTSTAATGSRSLYFYSYKPSSATTAPIYSYAALPAFEAPVNTLRVMFKLRRYGTTTSNYPCLIAMGVMSNPNDISTFDTISIADITSSPASSIHDYEVSLASYRGEGSYIAFLAPVPPLQGTATYAYNYIYLDSVVVDLLPACYRPEPVAVGDITANSIDLNWFGNASSYEVEYADNADFTNSSVTVVNDTTVTIDNLDNYTSYWFRVRGICGAGDSSEWSATVQAITLLDCGQGNVNIIDTIGNGTSSSYTYAFYSYSSYPRAFSSSIFTRDELMAMGLYSNNRINGIKLHCGTTEGTIHDAKIYITETQLDVWNSPVTNDTVNRNNMTLVYSGDIVTEADSWVDIPFTTPFNYSGNGNLMVSFVRDGSATANVNFYYTSLTNYYRTAYFYVSSGGSTYSSGTRSYYRANVVFNVCTEVPTCPRPANVTVNNIGETTATVHWNGTANNYEVEYGPEGFTHGNGTVVVATGDSVDLVNLTVGTSYEVYVRAICSATDTSDWSFAHQFFTACGAFPVPYYEGFEAYTASSTASIHPCWFKGTNNSTAYPYPSATVITGQRSLYFYGYHPSSASSTQYYSYVALPEFTEPVNTLGITFNMRRYSTTTDYYTSLAVVGVMSNPSDITTFVPVDTIDLKTAAASSIHEINVSFANYADTGKHIAILAPVPPLYGTSTYSYNYFYIDDIDVQLLPACPRAYNLKAYDGTATSVTLEWSDTINSTSWVIELTNESTGTVSTINVTSNPYTLTGLTAETWYSYRVAPICADGQQSDWSRHALRFGTAQVPATLPYNYDFEDAAEWQNWKTLTSVNNSNNVINWYRGTAVAAGGNYSMYLSTDGGTTHSWNTGVVTNAVAFRDVDFGSVPHSFEVSFDALMGGATDAFYDGIIVFTVDPATNYEVATAAITTPWGNVNDMDNIGGIRHDTVWTHHEFYLDNVSGVKRLVFYHFNNAGTHPRIDLASAVDNISIRMQTCERPGDLAVSDETLNGATLTWSGDPAALYQVAYRMEGAAASTNRYDTVRGTSYVVTNAQSSSTYNWWVRKICALTATDTNISGWSPNSTFSTLCGLKPLPYNEGFEGVEGHAYNVAGELPNCWDAYTNGTQSKYSPHVVDSGSYANYPHTGTSCLGMVSGSGAEYGNTKIAILPTFVQTINNLRMSFWYRMENASYGTLSVGYVTDVNNAENSFVEMRTFAGTTTLTQDSVFFDSVQAPNARIAFKWYYNSTWYTVGIDDIMVWSTNAGPVCNHPENVVASGVTHNSATLSWTGDADSYEVAIMQGEWVEPNAVTPVTNTTISYNNLIPGTSYNFGVRAVCDDALVSDWEVISFVTDILPCFVPTNLAVSNVTYTSAQATFTPGEAQTEWVLHLMGQGVDRYDTVNAAAATIGSLVHGNTYQLAVRAVCSNEESPWSDTVTFSTLSCDVVQGVTVTDITGTTARVSWTATGAASYIVSYGYQGSSQNEGTQVTASTNSVVLTGLDNETSYDVYVRSVCADGIMSVWSSVANFTTTSGSGPEPTYYTITVLANNNDWGTVSGGGSFLENTTTTISATANQGYHFVQWQDGNTDNPRTITVTADMTYTATFADGVGIDEVSLDEVSLYPNPATSTVTVRANGMEQVSIIDLNGRTVMTQRVNTETATFDLSTLAKGTYFVRIVGEQAAAVRKLVVK